MIRRDVDLDWLIVGGGVHGVHIATRLITDADVPVDAIRIVDPGPRLLERWHDCTATTGMSHLRSPSVHHLDVDPLALQRFAGKRKDRNNGAFAAPFERPSLDLFNSHCETLTRRLGLEEIHIRSKAVTCQPEADRVSVQLTDGSRLDTRHVVLALGMSDQPAWPAWAPHPHPRVHHVFDPGFDGWPDPTETVLVVGGGISAGHVSRRLIADGHQVHLVSRHPLREHQFDSDPGWLGPKYTTDFHRECDPDRRRRIITQARHRGSMPTDMARSIRRAIARGRVVWHEGEVADVVDRGERLAVRLGDETPIECDRILLATGFESRRPGGDLVDDLIASASLPCARCGYPIVDETLRWHPRVYVSGPLAELEIGPVSRNIAGARRAGDRIVAAVRSERTDRASA